MINRQKAIDTYDAVRGLLRVFTYVLLLLYLSLGFAYGVFTQTGLNLSSAIAAHRLYLALAALIIASWYINGTALNDYADFEIDQVNLANDLNRPLITGTLTKKGLLIVGATAGIISLLAALPLGYVSFITVAVLVALNAAYSLKPVQISRRGGIAPALLPIGYVALPLILGASMYVAHFSGDFYLLVAATYLQFNSRILLKDYRDVKGDAKFGKITFLLKYGSKRVCQLSSLALGLGLAIFVVAFQKYTKIIAFPAVLLASFAITLLQRLGNTKKWPNQRPLIAAYGRACSGILVLMIMCLLFQTEQLRIWQQVLLASTTGCLFIWSSIEILQS